jgi:hypothetical protein
MNQSDVVRSVSDQFQRTLDTFREAVLAFPENEWRRGDLDYLRPAGVAFHFLETIDYYTSDLPADRFPWGARFGVDWEESDSSKLPSQDQIIEYLDDIESNLSGWLKSTDFMSAEDMFPYVGSILLARAMYLLRHNQHHVAEMCLELTRRGYASPGWK